MPQHLRLVHDATVEMSRDARHAFCAEVICGAGRVVYELLAPLVDVSDERLDQHIRRLTDRDLTAAGLYAAHQGDFFLGSLITFEEGRRLGVLQATTDGGSAA